MVIKALEVSSTKLNICYTNTKYSSMILTVAVAEWLAYFPFDSYILGSSRVWRFSKNKLTERSLKCACLSVYWMVIEWWLKCDWNPPFPSPFSRHSDTIQSPFSRLKGEISSCVSTLQVNNYLKLNSLLVNLFNSHCSL